MMFRFTALTIALWISIGAGIGAVQAQQPIHWSPVQQVPGYLDDTLPPYMVADQNRTIHAFASQWVGEDEERQKAIVYRQWTEADGWTNPIDVCVVAQWGSPGLWCVSG